LGTFGSKMANLSYLKKRKRWRVRWHATCKNPRYIFSGSKNFIEKSQAVAFYAEIELQEKLVREGNVKPGESMSDVTNDFYRHITRHTIRTQQHYKFVIKRFVQSIPNSIIRIHQLRPAHIQEYLYRMAGKKNRTLNAHLTVIKSFCRYFSERYNIDNPASQIKLLKEDPPENRCLTKDEYRKVLEIAGPLAKDRIVFLAHTGLRASEFASLKPSSFNNGCITITGKGRRRRTIPLNKTARSLVRTIQPASKNALYLQFSRLAVKAGIPPFGPHALRHYCATQLLLNGVAAATVSKIMGVSVRVIEKHYAHILTSDISNATDVLDVL